MPREPALRWVIGPALRRSDQQLNVVYPEGRRHMSGIATTMAWADERYTGGGYAVYAPGQMTRFWALLRQAHGAIWFAGEHTETLAGYMESAVRSGHRVAAAIGLAVGQKERIRLRRRAVRCCPDNRCLGRAVLHAATGSTRRQEYEKAVRL